MTTQTDNTPTLTENSASPEKTLDDDIRELESKAKTEEEETTRATRATNALLIVTGVVAVLTALAGLWGTRASARLRVTENLLNSLRMTKVRADSDKEAKRVENEAQERESRIKADAEVKIAEAHSIGKQADEKAGEAHERAAEIERQNLELRGGVANLEKEAADARAAQQRIQTALAVQQQRAAKAELELAEVKRRQSPRRFFFMQSQDVLANGAKGEVEIVYPPKNGEAEQLARDIATALNWAQWNVRDIKPFEPNHETPLSYSITSVIEGRWLPGTDIWVTVPTSSDFFEAEEGEPLFALKQILNAARLRVLPLQTGKRPPNSSAPNSFTVIIAPRQ